jgi:mannose-6-phosphate isomerase
MQQLLHQPLRFEPFLRPMPWGGRRIARFLGKNLPRQPVGESWEVSDHPLHLSRLATASGYGVTLRELMETQRRELLGPSANRYERFPWLFKLLDANDWLSVQVHPDDVAVKRLLPGESSKTECWLVLDAEPSSRIYAGLKAGVDASELRVALEAGRVTECLHSFVPKAGDFVFLPAGVVHAVGGGVLMVEIQQTSDATFRLFDWNRKDANGQPRKLHIDAALASIHWDQGPIEPIATWTGTSLGGGRLVACPYFEVDWLPGWNLVKVGGTGRLSAMIITQGSGRFANGEYYMPGDIWILPAAMPAMELDPDAPIAGLVCTLPE